MGLEEEIETLYYKFMMQKNVNHITYIIDCRHWQAGASAPSSFSMAKKKFVMKNWSR